MGVFRAELIRDGGILVKGNFSEAVLFKEWILSETGAFQ